MIDISFLKNNKIIEVNNNTLFLNKNDLFQTVIISDIDLFGGLFIDNNSPINISVSKEKPLILELIYNTNEQYSIKNFFKIILYQQINNNINIIYNNKFFIFDNKQLNKYIEYINKPFNCKHCNYPINKNWTYCPNCGKKI